MLETSTHRSVPEILIAKCLPVLYRMCLSSPGVLTAVKCTGTFCLNSTYFAVHHTNRSSVADPDPYVSVPPGSASGSVIHNYGSGSGFFHHQAKIVRKTLISL
jgi:hypothetical protein